MIGVNFDVTERKAVEDALRLSEQRIRDIAENFPGIIFRRITYPDGAVYEGEFRDGKRSGTGRLIFPDGAVYEGEFADDHMNGRGTLVYANGDRYEGTFLDDREHGKGELVTAGQAVLMLGSGTRGSSG